MINEWLSTFKEAWAVKDIDRVLDLFTDDAEYWETPYQQIQGRSALRHEWSVIQGQRNIRLDLTVFSSVNDRHSVLWRLSYEDEKSEIQNWAGTYLIELNSAGKCRYFHQTGEAR